MTLGLTMNFTQNKLFSVILLLACIFVSLAISMMMNPVISEGMASKDVHEMILDVINKPGDSTSVQQISAISQLVPLIDSSTERKNYTEILHDSNISASQQIEEILKLTNSLAKKNTNISKMIDTDDTTGTNKAKKSSSGNTVSSGSTIDE
jgi:sugar-specific transcriptional regulator TrmB